MPLQADASFSSAPPPQPASATIAVAKRAGRRLAIE
jgi:hypothetical protein